MIMEICLKKTKVELDLLSDIDMLLMIKKCIRREICHAIYGFLKASNKCMNDHDRNTESSYLIISLSLGCKQFT